MPQITLNTHKTREFSEFLRKHGKETFFLAKDHGAYICATAGKHGTDTFERIVHYFSGCNPNKDRDFYETSRWKFGGDDFGQMLPADWIHTAADQEGLTKSVLNITDSGRISFKHYYARAKALA